MIVKFNQFEINIEAKCTTLSEDFNESDTFYFLNTLSVMAHDAAEANAVADYQAIADMFENGSDEIYQQLKATGYYDRLEDDSEC